MNDLKAPKLVGKSGDSLRETFGKTLVKIAKKYPNFVLFDADIAGGTGVHHFRKSYPNRFFQFGIAEQNMVSVAGGMSTSGNIIPIVTTFSVFFLRAYEQVRLSIAYSERNVKLVASHPGLDVGPDGASAQCLEDISAFRTIPNMTVIVPADHLEVEQATEEIIKYKGPVYMRTGRSPAPQVLEATYKFEIGKGKILKEGNDLSIFACGVQVSRALQASEMLRKVGVSAEIINISTIKPLDKELILKSSFKTKAVIVTEDHSIFGGLCSAISELLIQENPVPTKFVAVNDTFGESGEPNELAEKYELDASSIVQKALELVGVKE